MLNRYFKNHNAVYMMGMVSILLLSSCRVHVESLTQQEINHNIRIIDEKSQNITKISIVEFDGLIMNDLFSTEKISDINQCILLFKEIADIGVKNYTNITNNVSQPIFSDHGGYVVITMHQQDQSQGLEMSLMYVEGGIRCIFSNPDSTQSIVDTYIYGSNLLLLRKKMEDFLRNCGITEEALPNWRE